MSISKFEFLPNEIIIEIFEKYINGVELLTEFCQLNQRFSGLVAQCRRFRFNFIKCHKEDFQVCVNLLPTYIDKIEELSLSEWNTPGQIGAFLSSFPLFIPFKQLRKFYFHFDMKTVDNLLVEKLMGSLSEISLETLSIIITMNAYGSSPTDKLIEPIFRLTKLKQLYLSIQHHIINWNQLLNISLNIEYLIILKAALSFENFQIILRHMPHLKYLRAQVKESGSRLMLRTINTSNDNIITVNLRTLILTFAISSLLQFDRLEGYLKNKPNLRRLRINSTYHNNYELFSGNHWERLLTKFLPSLVYFDLNISSIDPLDTLTMSNNLESFQTPFWIDKWNFNIMLIVYSSSNSDKSLINHFNPSESNSPIIRWWLAPIRGHNDNFNSLKNITKLEVSRVSKPLPRYYHFNNIKQLVVNDLNTDLFKWISTYIDCSRIESLDISTLGDEMNMIKSLLFHTNNINSLRITYDQLLMYEHVFRERYSSLRTLDLSALKHPFDEADIKNISKTFFNIQHLIIKTTDLYNVPLLRNYLPHLRSLTFENTKRPPLRNFVPSEINTWDEILWQNKKISFHNSGNLVTVWIDQIALENRL